MTRHGRCSAGKAEEGDGTAMRARAVSGRSARGAGGVADRLARLVGRGRTRAARAERGERRDAGRAAGREALAASRSRPGWSGALDWAGRVEGEKGKAGRAVAGSFGPGFGFWLVFLF